MFSWMGASGLSVPVSMVTEVKIVPRPPTYFGSRNGRCSALRHRTFHLDRSSNLSANSELEVEGARNSLQPGQRPQGQVMQRIQDASCLFGNEDGSGESK